MFTFAYFTHANVVFMYECAGVNETMLLRPLLAARGATANTRSTRIARRRPGGVSGVNCVPANATEWVILCRPFHQNALVFSGILYSCPCGTHMSIRRRHRSPASPVASGCQAANTGWGNIKSPIPTRIHEAIPCGEYQAVNTNSRPLLPRVNSARE
jgi:hypothetical protein